MYAQRMRFSLATSGFVPGWHYGLSMQRYFAQHEATTLSAFQILEHLGDKWTHLVLALINELQNSILNYISLKSFAINRP